MTQISRLLKESELAHSETARLDVELLLAAALGKAISYLHTWPEQEVTEQALVTFHHYLQRRQAGEPVAYILGHQGFWSLELAVAEHTLIPRPDTETLVEVCLAHIPLQQAQTILDLGTGTGAIALAIASERPLAKVLGVDVIAPAVSLAEANKEHLQLTNVSFIQSHWFTELAGQTFDLIVSNPPYIAKDDPHLQQGDVRFEPLTALLAGEDGLADIRLIIEQAPRYLNAGGWLFLEHGYQQAAAVQALLSANGFNKVSTTSDLGGNDRVTGGQWSCS